MNTQRKNFFLLMAAFAAIYIIWGSTYFAIRLAIATIPPFLMAGSRFIIAGLILYAIAYGTGASRPTFGQIKRSFIVGFLLLACGNGGVVWAEQTVPSGIAALIVTIEPLWVVLLMWFLNNEKKPSILVWFGLLMGFIGIYILVGMDGNLDEKVISGEGLTILLLSTFAFAAGSVYASKAALPASPILTTSLQMLGGGATMFLFGSITNEWESVHLAAITGSSITAFLYLILFGSIIGYTSYSWLTKVATPSQVSTYAYVNPAIAVVLGTWLGDEVLTKEILIASPILITAVILLIKSKS